MSQSSFTIWTHCPLFLNFSGGALQIVTYLIGVSGSSVNRNFPERIENKKIPAVVIGRDFSWIAYPLLVYTVYQVYYTIYGCALQVIPGGVFLWAKEPIQQSGWRIRAAGRSMCRKMVSAEASPALSRGALASAKQMAKIYRWFEIQN